MPVELEITKEFWPKTLSELLIDPSPFLSSGVKPATGSTDRKLNEGETVTFALSDANGPVVASNFSFVAAENFVFYGNERATITAAGQSYTAKGGPQSSTISGSGNTAEGSDSWAAVESASYSLHQLLVFLMMLVTLRVI